jgi:hypothetical protein
MAWHWKKNWRRNSVSLSQSWLLQPKSTQWMDAEAENESRLNKALHYAAWALRTPAGQQHTQQGILFKSPAKLDFQHLIVSGYG